MPEMFNGIIGQVGIFPIKDSIKNMTVTKPGEHYGKQFNIEKTHTVAVKIAELSEKWITIGHRKFREGDELSWRVDCGSEWKDVWSGSTIFFFYEKNPPYVNVDLGSIKLMAAAPRPVKVYTFGTAASPSSDGGATGPSPAFDVSGAIKGNVFNCTMELLKYKASSPKFGETATMILRINEQLKAECPGANGPSIGMVIAAACKATKDVNKVLDLAKGYLENQLKQINAIYDGKDPVSSNTDQPQGAQPKTPEISDDDSDIPF